MRKIGKEPGYYLNLINKLREKHTEPQDYMFIYDIVSSEEAKLDAMSNIYNIGYLKGYTITEYNRIIDNSWINEWKTLKDCSEIYLEKLSREKVKKIKISNLIRNIEFNLNELKKITMLK